MLPAIRHCQALLDHFQHQIVGDQLSGSHDCLHPGSQRICRGHRLAEHIARGDMRHTQRFSRQLGLGPFARSGRAHKHYKSRFHSTGARGPNRGPESYESPAETGGPMLPAAPANSTFLQKSVVVAHDQLGFDLLNRVHGDTDYDQQRSAAKIEVDSQTGRDE